LDRLSWTMKGRPVEAPNLSVIRLLIAGGISAALVFMLCWISAELPYYTPAPNYVRLFTSNYPSALAFTEGVSWSLASGGIIGALVSLVYNGMARIGG